MNATVQSWFTQPGLLPILTGYPSPQCPSGLYWVTRPGDSFWIISQETGIPLEILARRNPFYDPANLPVGARICLSCPPTGHYWTVSPGDTIYSIAQRTGVSPEAILRLNPFLDPTDLVIGAQICLPYTD